MACAAMRDPSIQASSLATGSALPPVKKGRAGEGARGGPRVVTSAVARSVPDQDSAAPLNIGLALNRKLPVSDQVYEALKRAILTLQLMPGSSISENRICRALGVSRTPVRAALARLSEEDLIDV